MTCEEFWELFTETGEPVCWLVLRAMEAQSADEGDTAAS